MDFAQFSLEEAQAQVKRICGNRLFAKSANLQSFLEFLVTRRLSGTENLDDYSGKQLAFEFFKRDTSIAKVEGNKLRKRLQRYYEGPGRKDPIVIQIPPGPYRPEIVASPDTLPEFTADVAELVWAAGLLEPRREAAFYADRLLDKALAIQPGHPRLLGLKAKLYTDMTFIAGLPHKSEILGMARNLVNEARDTGVIPWEVSYADAALKAILDWDWKAADDAFRYANALSANVAPYCRWYLTFLMSQRRFRESMQVLQSIVEGTPTRWVGSNHEVFAVRAMFERMAGLCWESSTSLMVSEHLFPFIDTNVLWAFNCEAEGLPNRAVDYLSKAKSVPDIFDIMVIALKALCEGQLGHTKKARAAYDKIIADDARASKVADDPH